MRAGDSAGRAASSAAAALALERLEQRGLLAADVGAGTAVQHDRHTAEQVLPAAELLERRAEHLVRAVVLAAQVDEDVMRLVRVGGDQAALEEAERDALHDLAILERARLGLVRVDDEVVRLRQRLRLGDEAPLATGRESCAAAAAEVAGHQLLDHLVRRQRAGTCERGEAARLEVLLERPDRAAVRAAEDELGPVVLGSAATERLHERGHVLGCDADALAVALIAITVAQPQPPRHSIVPSANAPSSPRRPRSSEPARSKASSTCCAPRAAHEMFVHTSTVVRAPGSSHVVEGRDRQAVGGRHIECVRDLAQRLGGSHSVLLLRQVQAMALPNVGPDRPVDPAMRLASCVALICRRRP